MQHNCIRFFCIILTVYSLFSCEPKYTHTSIVEDESLDKEAVGNYLASYTSRYRSDSHGFYHKAKYHHTHGQYKEALVAIDNAIALASDSLIYKEYKIRILFESGNEDAAYNEVYKIENIAKEEFTQYVLSKAYFEKGQLVKADNYFNNLKNINPTSAWLGDLKVYNFLYRQDTTEAISVLKKYNKTHPERYFYLNQLLGLYLSKNIDSAKAIYERNKINHAYNSDFRAKGVDIYLRSNDHNKAKAIYYQLDNTHESFESLSAQIAKMHMDKWKLDSAMAIVDQFEDNKASLEILKLKADLLYYAKKYPEAKELYTKIVILEPDNFYIKRQIARVNWILNPPVITVQDSTETTNIKEEKSENDDQD